MTERSQRLAVLIDADNASASIVDELFAEIAKLGVASVKRIYGDFSSPRLGGWNSKVLKHAIQQMQQPAFVTGKNASDIALVIDAMDLLHSKRFDGFCLVSSDSDFTRLASRIREEGVTVYGFGERKTPESFVAACDKFIYTEILRPPVKASPRVRAAAKAPPPSRSAPVEMLRDAVEAKADDSGWAHLGQVGQVLLNRSPEFDPRNFGYKSMVAMFEGLPQFFDVRKQGSPGGSQTVYVLSKPSA